MNAFVAFLALADAEHRSALRALNSPASGLNEFLERQAAVRRAEQNLEWAATLVFAELLGKLARSTNAEQRLLEAYRGVFAHEAWAVMVLGPSWGVTP